MVSSIIQEKKGSFSARRLGIPLISMMQLKISVSSVMQGWGIRSAQLSDPLHDLCSHLVAKIRARVRLS